MQPKSEENPYATSRVEFLSVDLQGPDASIKRRYQLRYAMICVDSHDPLSFSDVRQPFNTPLFADEVKEGENHKEIAQTSKSGALQASIKNPSGFIGSISRNHGTEAGTTSEYTRYRQQITQWSEANFASWTYFRSDEGFLRGLNLPANSLELPIIDFAYPKNEGTLLEEMSVKLSSLWQVKNDFGDRKKSKFSFFSKKKAKLAEPAPIYTNFVPVVVIYFQPEALLKCTFERRTLILPVGADTTNQEQPVDDGVGGEGIRVIPSARRISTEERALELFEA